MCAKRDGRPRGMLAVQRNASRGGAACCLACLHPVDSGEAVNGGYGQVTWRPLCPKPSYRAKIRKKERRGEEEEEKMKDKSMYGSVQSMTPKSPPGEADLFEQMKRWGR